jgi:tetratricopeptide (TPR) repeat protein
MKESVLISLLIWIIVINLGKLWPTSRGEVYYRNLQKWYLLANRGDWEKAKRIEKKLTSADIEVFSKKNKTEELEKRLGVLEAREQKNADDWMEIAVLFYRLNKRDEAFGAIENAYKLDPIREDISKIYFTYQTYLLHSQ